MPFHANHKLKIRKILLSFVDNYHSNSAMLNKILCLLSLVFFTINCQSQATEQNAKVSPNSSHTSKHIQLLTNTVWNPDILDIYSSPVDLSFLNQHHRPAGKYGFIKRKGDQFVYADDIPIKFWGVNVQAYALFRTSDENIQKHAKRLSRLGFNLVRIHHHDSKWVKPNIFKNPGLDTSELSSAALKKLDWWITCLKEEGIYIWLDLHTGRAFTANDNIDHFDDIAKGSNKPQEVKGYNYFNTNIQARMKAFNETFLNHVNPYTKLAYKDDPAIIALLITNENDLTHHYGNKLLANTGVPIHHQLFKSAAKKYSKQYGLSLNKIIQTWKPGDSKFFLNSMEHRFNMTMKKHLQQLQVNALIATTNSWGRMGIFGLPSLTDGDLIDAHAYGKEKILNVNPRKNTNFLAWITSSQVTGYPLSVSEWNIEPFAREDRFISPVFVASTASLQSWDAIMLYGYSQHSLNNAAKGNNYSTFNDPAMMGVMPAAALLYRQQHISPAQNTYELHLPREKFFYSKVSAKNSKTINTLMETSHLTITIPSSKELPWVSQRMQSATNSIKIADPNKDFIPANQNFVTSDTGELTRNWEQGIQTINTELSKVVSGRLKNQMIKLGNIKFSSQSDLALFAVQSLDNQPLGQSSTMFVTTMARSKPTQGNKLPFLSEPVLGTIEIKAPIGLALYPVTPTGALGNAVNIQYDRSESVYRMQLQGSKHYWYILKKEMKGLNNEL